MATGQEVVKQFPPEGVHGRDFNDSKDTLWLYVTPKELSYSNVVNARGKTAVTTVPTNKPTYRFLMPTSFSTSQNHEWDKFETVGSKVNELATEISHASHNITGLNAYSSKADAPLFYKDSARREWTFEFQFIVHSNAYHDVWLPIQEFLQMSAPKNAGGGVTVAGATIGSVGIKIPFVFALQTRAGNGKIVPVLDVPEAVITSIQPKYEQPYIDGYPAKAELTLTFKDMNVLFNDSYRTSGSNEGVQVDIRENGVSFIDYSSGEVSGE